MKYFLLCLLICGGFFYCGGGNYAKIDPKSPYAPDAPQMILNEGITFLNQGDLVKAESRILQALGKKPNWDLAYNALGLVYMYKRDFPRAIDNFKKVLQCNPKYIDTYNSLGTIYTELGNYAQAKESLLIAANSPDYLTPENAYANLAQLELKQNKSDSALRYVVKGLLLNRKFAPLFYLKGVILENMGRLDEASENMEKAVLLTKESDNSYLVSWARLIYKLGNKQRAIDLLEKAIGQTQDTAEKQAIMKLIGEFEGEAKKN